jgi:hypothetical protein
MMAIIVAAEFGGQEWGNYVHDGGPGGIFSLLPYVPAFAGLIFLGNWLRDSKPRQDPPRLEPVCLTIGCRQSAMNRQKTILFVIALTLIGSTAGILAHLRTNQKLGLPGVTTAPLAEPDPDGIKVDVVLRSRCLILVLCRTRR